MSPGNNHQFVKTSHAFLRHSSKRWYFSSWSE
jgi:hypothetical protein